MSATAEAHFSFHPSPEGLGYIFRGSSRLLACWETQLFAAPSQSVPPCWLLPLASVLCLHTIQSLCSWVLLCVMFLQYYWRQRHFEGVTELRTWSVKQKPDIFPSAFLSRNNYASRANKLPFFALKFQPVFPSFGYSGWNGLQLFIGKNPNQTSYGLAVLFCGTPSYVQLLEVIGFLQALRFFILKAAAKTLPSILSIWFQSYSWD